MKEKIYLSPPHILGKEQKLVQQVLDSNWVAPAGPMLDCFENNLAAYVAVPFAVALNSATAAIHLGLQALGVQKGDKVLCATFTFVASVNPITYLGAIPILVDVETRTWNLCPVLLEKAILNEIKKGQKPKVLILVHGYGVPAKVEALLAIAKKYKILVLEDAAAALGSTYNQQACGTFGDIGVYSFNGNKIITTSGGGLLVTSKKKYREEVLYLATQAKKQQNQTYEHGAIGYNYRMSNVLAAIGVGQLSNLPLFLQARKFNFEYYQKVFSSKKITFLKAAENTKSNHWLTCVLFENQEIKEKVKNLLENNLIESRDLWKPMHQQEMYKKSIFYSNGVSEDLHQRGLCLPSGSALTEQELQHITSLINSVL